MTYHQHTGCTLPVPGFRPRCPQATAPVLNTRDREALLRHLSCQNVQNDPLLRHLVGRKLREARVPDKRRDQRTVAGNCLVTYRIGNGPERYARLCHRAASETGLILPVRSLLGATLIGMRVGQRAPLLRADCSVTRVQVQAVAYPT